MSSIFSIYSPGIGCPIKAKRLDRCSPAPIQPRLESHRHHNNRQPKGRSNRIVHQLRHPVPMKLENIQKTIGTCKCQLRSVSYIIVLKSMEMHFRHFSRKRMGHDYANTLANMTTTQEHAVPQHSCEKFFSFSSPRLGHTQKVKTQGVNFNEKILIPSFLTNALQIFSYYMELNEFCRSSLLAGVWDTKLSPTSFVVTYSAPWLWRVLCTNFLWPIVFAICHPYSKSAMTSVNATLDSLPHLSVHRPTTLTSKRGNHRNRHHLPS